MRNARLVLTIVLLISSAVAVAGVVAGPALGAARGLANGSFEATGDGIHGWTSMTGATNAHSGPENSVTVDRSVVHDGSASLRCTGNGRTMIWNMVAQSRRVRSGDRVILRVWARSDALVREGNQYPNANGLVIFKDAAGKRLGLSTTAALSGDRGWVELGIEILAPVGAATVDVGLFASQTGSVWFDDARLTVARGDDGDAAGRAVAFDALAGHLRRTYSYWGYAGRPTPDALFDRHRETVVAATDRKGFMQSVRAMLAELEDVHAWIKVPRGVIGTAPPAKPHGFEMQRVLAALDGKPIVYGGNVLAGHLPGNVGYLLIGSYQLTPEQKALIEKGLDALATTRALVIDVRPNTGGDENVAQRVAGRFVEEPLRYAQQRWRDQADPRHDAFLPANDRLLPPHPEKKRYSGRVIVLQGPACVSSAEGFLLMAKALPKATTVGQTSRGSSGNPGGFVVVPGLEVWTSRWQGLDLDGKPIEGVGVPPDVEVPIDREAETDPAIAKALELLAI